jgi:hypothetical protein
MALVLASLKRVGGIGTAPKIWAYPSLADSTATCDTAGYFNLAADKLQIGDLIFVAPTSAPYGLLVVNANSRDLTANPPVFGVVDTTSTTAVGAADSD